MIKTFAGGITGEHSFRDGIQWVDMTGALAAGLSRAGVSCMNHYGFFPCVHSLPVASLYTSIVSECCASSQ